MLYFIINKIFFTSLQLRYDFRHERIAPLITFFLYVLHSTFKRNQFSLLFYILCDCVSTLTGFARASMLLLIFFFFCTIERLLTSSHLYRRIVYARHHHASPYDYITSIFLYSQSVTAVFNR